MGAIARPVVVLVGRIGEVELSGAEGLGEHLVDARVGLPVGRADPDEGDVADLREHIIEVFLPPVADVAHEKLVAAEADKNIVRLILSDILLQLFGAPPHLGGGAVPDDIDERMAVFFGVGGQARPETLEHRVADEEDGLAGRVDRLREILARRLTDGARAVGRG